jgi:hypothetical protein
LLLFRPHGVVGPAERGDRLGVNILI